MKHREPPKGRFPIIITIRQAPLRTTILIQVKATQLIKKMTNINNTVTNYLDRCHTKLLINIHKWLIVSMFSKIKNTHNTKIAHLRINFTLNRRSIAMLDMDIQTKI